MTSQVVHRERLAWDAARVFVRALGSRTVVGWLRVEMGRQLGPAHATALVESWNRVWASPRADAAHIECGIWRARLSDLVADDGSLAGALQQLMTDTSAHLDQATDIQVPGPVEAPVEPGLIDLDRWR